MTRLRMAIARLPSSSSGSRAQSCAVVSDRRRAGRVEVALVALHVRVDEVHVRVVDRPGRHRREPGDVEERLKLAVDLVRIALLHAEPLEQVEQRSVVDLQVVTPGLADLPGRRPVARAVEEPRAAEAPVDAHRVRIWSSRVESPTG